MEIVGKMGVDDVAAAAIAKRMVVNKNSHMSCARYCTRYVLVQFHIFTQRIDHDLDHLDHLDRNLR